MTDMTMKMSDLCGLCGAALVGNPDLPFSDIVTDSRRLFVASRALFVALRGPRHDGARYVDDLYARGIRAFACHRGFDTTPYPAATFALVDDTLDALQSIAAAHRRKSRARIVAVCGSNGKTIVKEWLSQLVVGDIPTIRSPRSYNSQVGVPLSLLKIEPETRLAIIEAGISEPGEMSRLEKMVRPDDVIFTNIGSAHQEAFDSVGAKLEEKLKMAAHAQHVFFCADQRDVATAIRLRISPERLVCWGRGDECDYRIEATADGDNLRIGVEHGGETHTFFSKQTDTISRENLSHAIVYALATGVEANKVAERVAGLESVGMRMEQKEGHNGCSILDDAYNADVTSLEVALDMLHVMGERRKQTRTIILSDLQQTGLSDARLYARVGRLLDEKGVDRLVGIGPRISANMAGRPGAQFFESTDEFLRRMSTADFRNEAILLKGQRKFRFERIVTLLECLRNRTVMEINMTALAHNIAHFRHFLRPETKLLAMVKAYSYGTGSFEIAKLMQQQGVDYLGVAFADEGYELREAGISLPIVVMNPEEHGFDLMLKHDLEPQIYSADILDAYSDAVSKAGLERADIHIKFNTGMTRSGFETAEAADVARHVARLGNVRVVSAFSHLVESEDPTKDQGTLAQIDAFRTACATLRDGLGYAFMRHILNSAGIERFADHQMEMVRLGIGLYGVSAVDNALLKNVATLKSYVSMVREVAKGSTVGYNRRTTLARDSRIAVVPIGYADGVDRRLSNGVGHVLVNGRTAPIAGNVCMDICMVDVTDAGDVRAGDTVELFGDTSPVWEMSARISTIPYEVLTGIGRRVKRVYFVE